MSASPVLVIVAFVGVVRGPAEAARAATQGDKTDEIEGLTTKLDQATARSAKLKEEVAALQNELAKLVKSQAWSAPVGVSCRV